MSFFEYADWPYTLFESWCWLAGLIAWQHGYRAYGGRAKIPFNDLDPNAVAACEVENLAMAYARGDI